MRKLRWLWYACVVLAFLATYVGLFELPKAWAATIALVASMESWWSTHASHPVASAFLAGLAVSTVFLPELWLYLRHILFPLKPRPDISAAEAFILILARSKLQRKYYRHWKKLLPADRYESSGLESQNRKSRVEAALIRQLHTVLRGGDLKSWGCPATGTEFEEEIPSEKWATMEMRFEKRHVEGDTVHAWHSNSDPRDKSLAYTRIRFCKKELTRIFPLSIRRKRTDYTPYPRANLADI
jgi:hypothetical protein